MYEISKTNANSFSEIFESNLNNQSDEKQAPTKGKKPSDSGIG
jgi:hypothetical protein